MIINQVIEKQNAQTDDEIRDRISSSLNYKWKINNVDFFDGSNILYIDSVKPEHHGAVVCDVSNICGEVVSIVKVLVSVWFIFPDMS